MTVRFIDHAEVMASRNRYATWATAKARLRPEVWPQMQPSFQITSDAKIFTIGSCFARNIEEHLQRMGCDIPTLAIEAPPAETAGRRNSILNKYTPPSILQEIKWTSAIFRRGGKVTEEDCVNFRYDVGEDQVIDNNLDGFVPVTRERFFQRRRQVYDVFSNVFSADCVVITAGLVECWYDAERDLYVQQVPTGRFPQLTQNLKFAVLDFATCFRALDEAIAEIRELNPGVKFLLTTSPVPLGRTFSKDDVIVANSYSKSTLRSVCGELAGKWDGLDYFASYESVQLTRTWDVYQDDLLHVADSFVARIVARMAATYISDVADAEQQYRLSVESTGAPDVALEHARQAVELSPDNAEYNLRLGLLLMAAGQLEDAATAICRGHALQPTRINARRLVVELASAFGKRGDQVAARDLLIDAIARAPETLEFRQGLMWLFRQMGDLKAAEEEARFCVTLRPTRANPYFVHADILSLMERADEAITVLLNGLNVAPNRLPFLMRLGAIYHRMGNYGEAIAQYSRALEISPASGAARRNLWHLRQAQRKSPAQRA